MNQYRGIIIKEEVGQVQYNRLAKLCKLESAMNPSDFGYRVSDTDLQFVYTDGIRTDPGIIQLESMFEDINHAQVLVEGTVGGNVKQPAGSETDTVADGVLGDKILTAAAASTQPSVDDDKGDGVVVPNKEENADAVSQPQKGVEDEGTRERYILPKGMEIAIDEDSMFDGMIIDTGIATPKKPMINIRDPHIIEICKAENPDRDCIDSVTEFNNTVKALPKDSRLATLFQSKTGFWTSALGALLGKSMQTDIALNEQARKFRKKFSSLKSMFGQQGKSKGFNDGYSINTLGRSASAILKDILNKNGMRRISRSLIAIPTDNIPDLENITDMDDIQCYEISPTGKFTARDPFHISGERLAALYQYVDPSTSAGTYKKYFELKPYQAPEKQAAAQTAAAAQAASTGAGSPAAGNSVRAALSKNTGFNVEYLVFSPKRSLKEVDMLSNGTITGKDGETYHALTIRTTKGAAVGFYKTEELEAEFH